MFFDRSASWTSILLLVQPLKYANIVQDKMRYQENIFLYFSTTTYFAGNHYMRHAKALKTLLMSTTTIYVFEEIFFPCTLHRISQFANL